MELEKNVKEKKVYQNKTSFKEEIIDESPKNKILKLIKGLDKGNGVSIEEITLKDVEGVDKIVDSLLKKGDIFELKPGKLKVLE